MKWRHILGDKSTPCHDKEREKLGNGHVWLGIGKPINVCKMCVYSDIERLLLSVVVISLAFMVGD